MPQALSRDGVRLHYRIDGPSNAPAVLLCHSLGATHQMWVAQVASLTRMYRVIRYDARGHGGSDCPEGEYTIDSLGNDALAVLDAAGVDTAFVAGISMGGQIALWLAAQGADRTRGIVLANTAARIGNDARWKDRIELVRQHGMKPVGDKAIETWFSAAFRARESALVETFWRTLVSCSPVGYIGCCSALRDADLRKVLPLVVARTLVIAGSHDVSTTVADAEALHHGIAGSEMVVLDAAHLSNVEQPQHFTSHVERFLASTRSHLHA